MPGADTLGFPTEKLAIQGVKFCPKPHPSKNNKLAGSEIHFFFNFPLPPKEEEEGIKERKKAETPEKMDFGA